jgi:hypothetical protein
LLAGELAFAGDLATPFILRRGLQIGTVDDACDLGPKDFCLRQSPDDPIEQGLSRVEIGLHDLQRLIDPARNVRVDGCRSKPDRWLQEKRMGDHSCLMEPPRAAHHLRGHL